MDEQREHHWNGDRLIELEAPPILSLGLEEEEPGPRFSDLAWPIVLFLLTVFTTLWAGAYATRSNPKEGPLQFLLGDPAALLKGLPFAGTLLGILVTHEFGHYLFSRIHRVPASLPLFIPGPPHFIGTFGAVIRMRSPILSRRALFDIGVGGPPARVLGGGRAGGGGVGHPPVRDPRAALGRTRIWVGWGALAIFVLTFAPIPFSVY